MSDYTENSTFNTPVAKIADGAPVTESILNAPIQYLINRTKWLYDKVMTGTVNDSDKLDGQHGSYFLPKAGSFLIGAILGYDGTTDLVKKSFNIASVTHNSSGVYTVNFTNALPDAYYVALVSAGYSASAHISIASQTTTSIQFLHQGTNVGGTDVTVLNLMIMY